MLLFIHKTQLKNLTYKAPPWSWSTRKVLQFPGRCFAIKFKNLTMYFNKIAITLLVIFSICASFVIGYFSKDFYNHLEESKRQAQAQFLMQINSNRNIASSTTPYEDVLRNRQLEAERIMNR